MAHESLVNQLVNKTVTRKYTAVVHGLISHDDGTIDARSEEIRKTVKA